MEKEEGEKKNSKQIRKKNWLMRMPEKKNAAIQLAEI